MAKQMEVAVYGLGAMGYGVASSLLRAGHAVYGVDVVDERMAQFVADGGMADDVSSALTSLDCVVVVVLNAAQTESVLFGENGVTRHLKPGASVISCATVPASFAKDAGRQCAALGLHYLDAPISGGSVKAAQGALSVMAAGTPDAFEAAGPALDAMAETVFRLGDLPGPGSAMKSVNQLLAGVHIAAMAEAMTFGLTQGVEPQTFVDVISKCAGTSWMLENRAPHIVAGDYTPHSAINIWPKDLGIVLESAREAGFEAPITEAALEQFVSAAEAGLGGEDDAAVAKVYARRAGLKLPGDA